MSKKKRKPMSPETKNNLKNIFGSLYSNQRAIDAARHNPWWAALIVFILSICIPVVPIVTSGMNQYGSSVISNSKYGFDITGTAFAMDMIGNDIDLKVNDKHQLVDVNDSWEAKYGYDNETVQYAYINENSKQYDLLVYYTHKKGSDFKTFQEEIGKNRYEIGSTNKFIDVVLPSSSSEDSSTSEDVKPEPYIPTFILMNQDYFIINIFKPNSTVSATSMAGDYLTMEEGTSIASFALENGFDKTKYENKNDYLSDSTYVEKVTKNWANFLDESFITTRNTSTMYSSLLTLGIYFALTFFLGLMIFLLTRGKRNVFHILTFLECQKINAWASFTPALLALILGFILPQGAMMFYIVLTGVRIMWLSMKQLRPQLR